MKIGNNGHLVWGLFDESTPCLTIVLMNFQTKLRINHLTAVKSVAILESDASCHYHNDVTFFFDAEVPVWIIRVGVIQWSSQSRSFTTRFQSIEVKVGITFQDGDRFNSYQVIYSQFGLAIHQNHHQARRRFVEWAPNEIAVVPDFHKRILFSDEAQLLVEWLRQQTKLPHLE
ncbi:hypothetical protein TNCV_2328611 [Trichonephila clavipes]|nr:hypothetical protein TNCV_2328611 [Trichonephila clavipes]